MTTKATSSKNCQLMRGDGAGSETFTLVAEVLDWKGPSEKTSPLDATSLDSVAFEYIGGLPDNGDLTFNVNWVATDAQQQGLRTDLRAGTKRNFKLVLNDKPVGGTQPTTVAFAAIVTGAPELTGGVNKVVMGSCSLRITGQPTYTYAV